jgi:hypothetical protein
MMVAAPVFPFCSMLSGGILAKALLVLFVLLLLSRLSCRQIVFHKVAVERKGEKTKMRTEMKKKRIGTIYVLDIRIFGLWTADSAVAAASQTLGSRECSLWFYLTPE